jgi:hypothetical protein
MLCYNQIKFYLNIRLVIPFFFSFFIFFHLFYRKKMSIPLPPSSPSARQLRQPSPTSPSYSEHQYKRTLLDDVKNWSEQRVTDWLCNQALGRFSQRFIGI